MPAIISKSFEYALRRGIYTPIKKKTKVIFSNVRLIIVILFIGRKKNKARKRKAE